MRGQFIGSGGVMLVHLPRLLSEEFGISVSEARRLLATDQVTLDGEVCGRVDIEVERITGARLAIGKNVVEVGG